MLPARGRKWRRVRERECLSLGRTESKKECDGWGNWKKRRRSTGGNLSHKMSKKVKSREVVAAEVVVSGGGATRQASRTFTCAI